MQLALVTGPDPQWAAPLQDLLAHKGKPWTWQIEQSLTNANLGIESRFYILVTSGRAFASVCTFERNGVGILGHVFTGEDQRRKGVANILMQKVLEHFRERSGRALYLATEYNIHPYHLYRKHSFVSAEPESGFMYYFVNGQEAFEASYFAPAKVTLESPAFKHWPTLPALTMMNHPARLRVLGMEIVGPVSSEACFLQWLMDQAEGKDTLRIHVAISDTTGAPVALACVGPDHYFGSTVDLMDVFWAPGFESAIPQLIDSLDLVANRKTICYVDSAWPEKAHAFKSAGFTQEASRARHLKGPDTPLDVTIWSR